MAMDDKIRKLFDKEGEIDRKIKELESIITAKKDEKLMMASIRAIIEDIKEDLVSTHYKSITDDLTGFLNKKATREIFEKRLVESLRDNHCVSIILLDMDNLKDYNDTHGHLAGTELIVNFSKAISKSIRKSDIASRYGGDEFMIVCVNNNEDGVIKIIKRLRENIGQIPTIGSEHASASIGYASCCNDVKTYSEIFQIADKMLYEEKKTKKIR